jgi:predicted TIM-barrel fold metal-dependent hydrolase
MMIIDSQVHAYEANTLKRPWHSVPNWPDHVMGDEMVAAMDKVGVDGAIFISAFSMYRYDANYAVEVQRAYPSRFAIVKPVDPRSRRGRCHRRLEADTGRCRHPHHDDAGGQARAD